MRDWNLAFRTPSEAPGWQRWLVYSALARVLIFAALVFVFGFLVLIGLHALGWSMKTAPPDIKGWSQLIVRTVPTVFAYLILTRLIERRWPAELAWRKLPAHASAGLVLGTILLCTVVGVLWLAGSYHVLDTGGEVHWLAEILTVGLGAGISEEIVFRGVLYRIVEESLGTWIALLVSALAFGAIHLGNPNATLWSGTAIAIEAGVLFGLVYHVTRSLWFCMGLHAAWNLMEGPVLGTSVSGLPAQGWVHAQMSGPDWLSGGSFGPEASLVTPLCSLALAGVFLFIALRRSSIVPPFWARRAAVAS
ncbi:CPBP family intramembrane glutamic endopeptidase [Oleiagrimonas soli]|uniref:CAAX prenyl protease 2/Lysostaphin resistance protein A-like domain-containing protein n=1 Tax=Oleiagrimonas soli TaxID=1543381 RepID=A0A099CX58_9GAMM|nr:type II CAAX endopeptidase family protein [Oleiagrimonas soli]KGI78538.1 hypothetical protein LF63_0103470 [Oleiagrimonas soli]MBB6184192.1 hypothetical protein [Oleiagrimonas soli]